MIKAVPDQDAACCRGQLAHEFKHEEHHNGQRAGEDDFLVIRYLTQTHDQGKDDEYHTTAQDPPVGAGQVAMLLEQARNVSTAKAVATQPVARAPA